MAFAVKLLVNIIYLGVCVALVGIIISQQGKTQSLGALTGQSSSDTYWAKNKGRSAEGRLRTATIVLTVLFFALSIFLNTGIVD
ncbi:preprotein translocase subunit SecG [Butyrivibrio fibrisolvens]|jgi:preprotein translocase subunit SecG|uniref:Protein-export membrane protein SecG n=1 Tax=Butyrivibrio fibrisolvens TaxID=831 RepID=A0A317G466_BUTFI|nr:preprotein translocase subunit SecG [Butyrivibrio fibrisolvens]PWT28864.1 preprotein translocase subunit SecG [Butyrivibrio fibrisolvens]